MWVWNQRLKKSLILTKIRKYICIPSAVYPIKCAYWVFWFVVVMLSLLPVSMWSIYRADFRFAPSQWETLLQSNAVSHCLSAKPRISPDILIFFMLASLPLGHTCDYHKASDVSLKDMGKIDRYLATTKQQNVNYYWNILYFCVVIAQSGVSWTWGWISWVLYPHKQQFSVPPSDHGAQVNPLVNVMSATLVCRP